MKTMLQWGLLLTVALPLFANSSWESLRRAALERRRMVIYNTDGCDAGVYFLRNLAATPENFLSRRLIHVRGSQVDSVFYCPISSGFGNFTCRLKTADWFIKDAPMYPKFRNISRDLNRLGTDPLRLAGEFCRREKLEFFVSIRVNDTHDAAGTLENPHHLLPKFKQEHPEFLMGTPDRRPPYCSWSAVDFSHPEVRARMRNFVREFAAGYDIDGIEYDFMRHMQLFRSVAWGGVASSRELATMTEFLRELRAITEEEGRKRGRPILVAIRVPDSPEYCRAVGIDLEAWLKNRVTDLLIAGGYFHLEPWSNMVALARRYGVKFYASLDESRIRTSLLAAPERNSAAGYHARALEALESGADGLYYFNLEGADAMRRLLWGNKEKLRGVDKAYYARVRGSGGYQPGFYLRGGDRFLKLPALEPAFPQPLFRGRPFTFPLFIGDDLSQPEVRKRVPSVSLRFAASAPAGTRFPMEVNEHHYTAEADGDNWVLRLPPEAIRKGKNHILIAAEPPAGNSDWKMERILSGKVLLRHSAQGKWRRLFPNRADKVESIVENSLRITDWSRQAIPNFIHPLPARNGIFSVGFSLLVEPESEAGTVVARIAAGKKIEVVEFRPDEILFRHSGNRIRFSTTDRFHRYELSSDGTALVLTADGHTSLRSFWNTSIRDEKARLTGHTLSTEWMNSDSLLIGSLSKQGLGASRWKEIDLEVPAVQLRDAVLLIEFPEQPPGQLIKAAAQSTEEIASLAVRNGELQLSSLIRNRYQAKCLSTGENSVTLNHSGGSGSLEYQCFEIPVRGWGDPLRAPVVMEWRAREVAPASNGRGSFMAACMAGARPKGSYEFVFCTGFGRILLPWGKAVTLPGPSTAMHTFRAILDPESGLGGLWIDGKIAGWGPVPSNPGRPSPFCRIGDASGSISGKVQLEYFKLSISPRRKEK